ncbi:MAG TPA: HEAT repeat domain-containing protein, partial [Polyangiaceae bacterium]|nr:HEAT repeat domain-containing protein [Polyangiaceae bacterium]
PIELELRQTAALAIAAQRDAAAVRTLRRALLADDESSRLAHEALLAHPPQPGTAQRASDAASIRSAKNPMATPKATSTPSSARMAATRARVARDAKRMPTAQLLDLLSTAPQAAGLAACQLAARDELHQRDMLKSLLSGRHRALRLRVALGLGASPRTDATGLLLQTYRDSAWQVRWAVLHALGQRRDVPSLRTLQRAAILEPNREARDLARSLIAADAIAPRLACPALLPLAGLQEVDEETAVAAPNDLPEAAPAREERPTPHP